MELDQFFFFKNWFYSSNLRLGVIGFSLWLWVLGCVFGFSYFHFSYRFTIILCCCVLLIVVIDYCDCFHHHLVVLMWCSFHYYNCVARVMLVIVVVFFLLVQHVTCHHPSNLQPLTFDISFMLWSSFHPFSHHCSNLLVAMTFLAIVFFLWSFLYPLGPHHPSLTIVASSAIAFVF